MLYRANYVCTWGSTILALLAAPTLAAWGLVLLDQTRGIGASLVLVAIGVSLLCGACGLRTEHRRVVVRGGRFFFASPRDATPRTPCELVVAVQRIYCETGSPPVVVGTGWGFFLKQEVGCQPRLFMHLYRGRIGNDPCRWRSGTTIREISAALAKLSPSLAFDSHPSFDEVSIGGAYAMGNHGNGGDLNNGFTRSMKVARVMNMETGDLHVLDRGQLRRLFDDPTRARRHLVVEVELDRSALVPNIDVQKRLVWVDTQCDAEEWLREGAYLRVLFVGHARQRAMGLRWCVPTGDADHRDPHFGSTLCMSLQADVCSAFCNCCIEPDNKWTGVISRREANRFSPSGVFVPLIYIVLLLSGTRNFEIVFKYAHGCMTASRLHALKTELYLMHARLGGRSEIRVGRLDENAPIFLDVSMVRGFNEPFTVLKSLGVERVALHPGKMQTDTTPLLKCSLAEMYNIETTMRFVSFVFV